MRQCGRHSHYTMLCVDVSSMSMVGIVLEDALKEERRSTASLRVQSRFWHCAAESAKIMQSGRRKAKHLLPCWPAALLPILAFAASRWSLGKGILMTRRPPWMTLHPWDGSDTTLRSMACTTTQMKRVARLSGNCRTFNCYHIFFFFYFVLVYFLMTFYP